MGYLTLQFFLEYLEWRDSGRRILDLPPDEFALSMEQSDLLAVTCEFLGFLDGSLLNDEEKGNVREDVAGLAAGYEGRDMDAVDAERARVWKELNPNLLDDHVETLTLMARHRYAARQGGGPSPEAAERLARQLMRHVSQILQAEPPPGEREGGSDGAGGDPTVIEPAGSGREGERDGRRSAAPRRK